MNVTISNSSVTTGINFTATALTFGISGTLSPVAGGSGATVTLSGAAAATTTSDGAGNYSFSGLTNGTYTVTPSHTGYTFNPISKTASVSGASVAAINFTATAQIGQTYSITGTISPITGGSGSTVTLSGAAVATTTTDSTGNYTFTGLFNGTYAVTPSHTGYTFNPSVQTAIVNGANVSGVNFSAQSNPTFSISGTISPVTGGSGSTVTLSGAAAATTVANSSGNYTFGWISQRFVHRDACKYGIHFQSAESEHDHQQRKHQQHQLHCRTSSDAYGSPHLECQYLYSIRYNVYRSIVSGSSYVKINPVLKRRSQFYRCDRTEWHNLLLCDDGCGRQRQRERFSNEVPAAIP